MSSSYSCSRPTGAMPLWGKASRYEKPVEAATSEKNVAENWQAIMMVSDMLAVETDGYASSHRAFVIHTTPILPRLCVQTLSLSCFPPYVHTLDDMLPYSQAHSPQPQSRSCSCLVSTQQTTVEYTFPSYNHSLHTTRHCLAAHLNSITQFQFKKK